MNEKNKTLSPIKSLACAREVAIQGHGRQMYGDKPYTYHLEQVVDNVLRVNSAKDIMSALSSSYLDTVYTFDQICKLLKTICWLHDIIEDTVWTEQSLLDMGFAPLVVDAVVAITKVIGESNNEYLQRLFKNPWAVFCKKSDSFSNLQNSLLEGRIHGIVKYTENLKFLTGSKAFPVTTNWK